MVDACGRLLCWCLRCYGSGIWKLSARYHAAPMFVARTWNLLLELAVTGNVSASVLSSPGPHVTLSRTVTPHISSIVTVPVPPLHLASAVKLPVPLGMMMLVPVSEMPLHDTLVEPLIASPSVIAGM